MVEYGERKEEVQEVPGLGRRRVIREFKGADIGWVIVEEGAWVAAPEVVTPEFRPVVKEVPVEVPVRAPPPPPPEIEEELPTEVVPIRPPPAEELARALETRRELMEVAGIFPVSMYPMREPPTKLERFMGLVREAFEPSPPPERITRIAEVPAPVEPVVIGERPAEIPEVPMVGVRGLTGLLVGAEEAGRAAAEFIPTTAVGIASAIGKVAEGEELAGVVGEVIMGAASELAETGEAIIRAPGKLFSLDMLTETERKELEREFKTIGKFAGRTGAAAIVGYVLKNFPGIAKGQLTRLIDKIKGKKHIVQTKISATEWYRPPKPGQEILGYDPVRKTKLVWDPKQGKIIEQVLKPDTTIKVGKDWVAIYEEPAGWAQTGALVTRQPLLVRPDIAKTLVTPEVVTPALEPAITLPQAAGIALLAPTEKKLPPEELPITEVRPEFIAATLAGIGVGAAIAGPPAEKPIEIPKIEVPLAEEPLVEEEEILPAVTPRITPAPPLLVPMEPPRLAPPVIRPPKEPRRVEKPRPEAPLPPLYPFGKVERRRPLFGFPRLRRPTRYVPSFAAIALGITAPKRPPVITGFELRPIIEPEKPVKKKKKRRPVQRLMLKAPTIKFRTLVPPKVKRVKRRKKKKAKRR